MLPEQWKALVPEQFHGMAGWVKCPGSPTWWGAMLFTHRLPAKGLSGSFPETITFTCSMAHMASTALGAISLIGVFKFEYDWDLQIRGRL